jgi:glycine cleavage system pyridoxal-binding protein P
MLKSARPSYKGLALKKKGRFMSDFPQRHIGNSQQETSEILSFLGFTTMSDFIKSTLPETIFSPMAEKDHFE